MALDFKDFFMGFSSKGKEIELRGKGNPIISLNNMKTILKKGHHGVITQLCSLDVQTSIAST
jgi:hypothetical protein